MAISKLKLNRTTGKYSGVATIVTHPAIETQFIIIAPDSGMLQRVANILKLELDPKKNKTVDALLTPFQ